MAFITRPKTIYSRTNKYYHAAAGYVTTSTLLAAIQQGFYATWPLLTERVMLKHLHAATKPRPEINNASQGQKDPTPIKKYNTYAKVYNLKNIMYTNQIGASHKVKPRKQVPYDFM